MPLPVDFDTGTVTGRFTGLDGDPVVGSVTFTAVPLRLVSAATKTVVIPVPLRVELDVDGAFSRLLPATDDPDINPVGFTYKVTENFAGGQMYAIDVPVGVTTDLADVAPVDPATGATIIRGTAHAATHADGGTDEVTLAQSQVTGLVDDLAAATATWGPWVELLPTAHDGTAGWYSITALDPRQAGLAASRRSDGEVRLRGTAIWLDATGNPAPPPALTDPPYPLCDLPAAYQPADGRIIASALLTADTTAFTAAPVTYAGVTFGVNTAAPPPVVAVNQTNYSGTP